MNARRLLASALAAAALASAGCVSAPRPDAAAPPEETIRLRFETDEDLAAWRIGGGEWVVKKGAAFGRQVGNTYAYLTYPVFFGAISSVTIRGGIASADNFNFRIAIGHVSAIFNWELADQNIYRDQTWGEGHNVRPRALSPGQHEIRFVEDGDVIRILVDGREVWETTGRLRGTVTVYPAVGSTIEVREVEIRGTPVPWIAVDGPSMRAP